MSIYFKFEIHKTDKKSKARAGKLTTPHGVIHTPNFIPVATQGSVKALDPRDLKEIGIEIVLGNTYHLHLRPGEDVIAKFGGLAKFMGWNNKPTMTDSGGFQVFSLGIGGDVKMLREEGSASNEHLLAASSEISLKGQVLVSLHPRSELRGITFNNKTTGEGQPKLARITEEGVEFTSHIDGRKLFLSPESSIEIQEKLGADLIVGFDDLESPKYNHEQTKKSLELTNRWLLRSKRAHKKRNQLLYGVTHGGQFEDLRIQSAKLNDAHFDAIALGGAHKNKENMYDVIEWTVMHIDEKKPRHLFGVGEIDDMFNAIERGIDTFDCVVPTRLGRMGWAFFYPPEGNIKNRFRYDLAKSQFSNDKRPIANDCSCYVCQNFTRGYIHHLFRARELLSYRLITYHNLYFFNTLMNRIREAIEDNTFLKLKNKWLHAY